MADDRPLDVRGAEVDPEMGGRRDGGHRRRF
jgi:hypothetical protein